jgi:hypothetical protein
MLATAPFIAPSMAQDATDPVVETDTTNDDAVDGTTDDAVDADGNFSRQIPEGLKANLTEQEIADYQARLDAAATPQERNTIRQELQRTNQERHLAKVQETKQEQQQNKPQKGFFESMRDDFKDVVSGKAANDAKAARASNDALIKQSGKNNASGKAGGNSGKSGGNNGKSGGNGGGNGGGKNK